jgi:integrase
MSITIRKRPDNRWEADVGKVLGRRRRFVRDSKEDAQGAAKAFLKSVNYYGGDMTMEQAQEASAAFGQLREAGSSMSLLAIVETFLESTDTGIELRPTVGEAIELRLKAMRDRNLRQRSIQSTQYRLAALSGVSGDNIARVGSDALRAIVQQIAAPATRSAAIAELSAFFEFCRKRGWIKENPCDFIEKPKVDYKMPRFMPVVDAERLLRLAAEVDPFLAMIPALGLFAGLRPEEMTKLAPSDIVLGSRAVIIIRPEVSKVRRSRIIGMSTNLQEWLAASSLAGSFAQECARFQKWRKSVKVSWSPDIMRHTFATHHYALHQNAALTCAEMGNSSDVMFKHYRGLATKEEAEKYFSIMP